VKTSASGTAIGLPRNLAPMCKPAIVEVIISTIVVTNRKECHGDMLATRP
jgi:hypothetical protein